MSGLEGIYRSGDSLKRKQEVLDRVRAGIGVKQIAADLGVERHTVDEIIESLRAEGDLPEAPTTEIRPA